MPELKIGGEAFDTRVVEEQDRILIFYDMEFEEQFEKHDAVLNALDNFAKAQDGYSDKTVVFRASDL